MVRVRVRVRVTVTGLGLGSGLGSGLGLGLEGWVIVSAAQRDSEAVTCHTRTQVEVHPRKDDVRVGHGLAYSDVAASSADGMWLR